MLATNTAILFVDSKKKLDGQTIASVEITCVALVTRILNDLERVRVENILVVANEDDVETRRLLENSKAEFEYFLFDEGKWSEKLSGVEGNQKVLVLTADRLFDHRFLSKFVAARTESGKAVIAVDFKETGGTSIAERIYTPNDGKLIGPDLPAEARETGINILPSEVISTFEGIDNEYIQNRTREMADQEKAEFFDIDNGFVEVIDSKEAVKQAEQKLFRYIWKEVDGIHSRLNKRIILPFLKVILKTPITPNMISLVGVLIALLAAYFYSKGFYLDSMIGATLGFGAALLDHVDGSIARMKSMESDFGAHFDTLCDYIYYVSFGVGMTIGLYRSSGNEIYIALGLAALMGTIISLFTTSYQRKVLAENASLYGAEAHRRLDANTQNPIIKYSRLIYFVIRRPVLPYYVFILTALTMLPFMLFMIALASNLFWMFHLYTNKLYRTETKT